MLHLRFDFRGLSPWPSRKYRGFDSPTPSRKLWGIVIPYALILGVNFSRATRAYMSLLDPSCHAHSTSINSNPK